MASIGPNEKHTKSYAILSITYMLVSKMSNKSFPPSLSISIKYFRLTNRTTDIDITPSSLIW